MSRRPSLPGIDELFGSSAAAASPTEPEVQEQEVGTGIDPTMLAGSRRLIAAEDGLLAATRRTAESVLTPPSPELGSLLRWAVSVTGAKAIVEVGTSAGVSGLWMLEALPARGVLTSIEPDEHTHRLASEAFRAAAAGTRVRSIHGDAGTVLPRLADKGYDLVVLQASPASFAEDLVHARRLLREGGMLIVRGVLRGGVNAEANARFLHELIEDPWLHCSVLPFDDGVALATRIAD